MRIQSRTTKSAAVTREIDYVTVTGTLQSEINNAFRRPCRARMKTVTMTDPDGRKHHDQTLQELLDLDDDFPDDQTYVFTHDDFRARFLKKDGEHSSCLDCPSMRVYQARAARGSAGIHLYP